MIKIKRGLWLSGATYFAIYAAGAALLPFLAVYYSSLALSGEQIGILAGISPLVRTLVGPVWAGVADASHKHKLLLILAIAGTIAGAVGILLANTFAALIPIVILFAFFGAPTVPMIDSAVLDLLGSESHRYGRLRLWGAVGWGLVAPVVGWLVQHYGLSWAFYGYYLMYGFALAFVLGLPIHPARMSTPFWRGVGRLMRARGFALFLGTLFVFIVGRATLNSFIYLHLSKVGVPESLMGLSLAVASVSELPIFFFSDRLIKRFGSRGLLIISMVCSVAMLLLVGWMRAPWLILPIQLLHGPSFSAMWLASVSFAAEAAPKGMATTAQGLVGAVPMGLGSAVSAVLAGLLFERLGGAWMYTVNAGLVVVALVVFVGFIRAGKRRATSEQGA